MRHLIVTPILSTLAIALPLAISGAIAGCTGGPAAGTTDQSAEALQKKTDGSATGNGQTCSWDGTSYAAVAVPSNSDGTSSSSSSYPVGASFKSPDACNDCSCSAQGILCTVRECTPGSGSSSGDTGGTSGGVSCTDDCPDSGRTGPVACPAIARVCPDGSSVSPSGPNCVVPACPVSAPCTPSECGAVPALARLCPDGKTVATFGPCARTNGACGYAPISCPNANP